jgi:hypothetical protein
MSCIADITVDGHSHVILIFGSGLIGSAISRDLSSCSGSVIYPLFIDWNQTQSRQLQNTYHKFAEVISQKRVDSNAEPKVHIVWAAGLCGFYSDECQTKKELAIFLDCLERTSNLVVSNLGHRPGFHLASSIGGLFEGQYLVSDKSVPCPIRPYGKLKYSQEKLLSDFSEIILGYVYRLSSVYGFINPQHRKGLISTLIENSVKSKQTLISGSMHTLRDFVWAPNVARFVTTSMLHGRPSTGPIFLASGKSETVENIKRLIEFSLRRKVYSRYLYTPTNDASICVSQAILPCGWSPSYCTSNIPHVVMNHRLFKNVDSMKSVVKQ